MPAIMRRPNRLVAGVMVAAFVLAICFFGAGPLIVPFGVAWVLLPDLVPVLVVQPGAPCDEQIVPLLSLVSPRGPPQFA
jgi:hypothetical protein